MSEKNIILDLCGGSGAWSRPYKEAGFDMRVITLPNHNVFYRDYDWDLNGIYFYGVNRTGIYSPYEKIYGIFAAPPCTEFSVAKGNGPRDLRAAMEIVKVCLEIIWEVQLHAKLAFWALENPRGLLRQFLGIPKYTFEQWEFGTEAYKPTDIWGYFNPPKPTVKTKPEGMTVKYPNGRSNGRAWAKCEYPPEYEAYINQFTGDEKRAAARAITPAGFAKAFFKANSREVTP